MIETMLDHARSLASLMEEETGELARKGRCGDHEELVAAKRRLAAQLEAEIARLNRERGDWAQQLDAEDSEALQQALATLRDAAAANANIVGRHLTLSTDMMDAVAAEAKRLTGNGGNGYQQCGAMFERRGGAASPISINTRL